MKRSEALKIIDDTYSEFCEDWIRADLDNLEGFVALNERILSALERAGMIPPARQAIKWSELGVPDEDQLEKPRFSIYKWEPEE